MEDDPSLFLSSAAESDAVGTADYLELPATSSEAVEAVVEPSAVPVAAT